LFGAGVRADLAVGLHAAEGVIGAAQGGVGLGAARSTASWAGSESRVSEGGRFAPPKPASTISQRRRLQSARRMSLARASSRRVAGWSSFRRSAQSSLYSSSSSGATVLRVEKRPKVRAFAAERALPGSVRGPVEACALFRLAWI
jgi:hypothetical protein